MSTALPRGWVKVSDKLELSWWPHAKIKPIDLYTIEHTVDNNTQAWLDTPKLERPCERSRVRRARKITQHSRDIESDWIGDEITSAYEFKLMIRVTRYDVTTAAKF